MGVLKFSSENDEVVEVTYEGRFVATLDHDTLGWTGMDAAEQALKCFAEEAGIAWVSD